MAADSYVTPATSDPVSTADAIARLAGMATSARAPEYTVQVLPVDLYGNVLTDAQANPLDWSPYLAKDSTDQVTYDSTTDVAAGLTIHLSAALSLQWGQAMVQVYQLIRNQAWNVANGYGANVYHRFAVGLYVLTSPGYDDLDVSDVRTVTGFDKNYLLQTAPKDSLSFDIGSTYINAIKAVFRNLGIMGSSESLIQYADYPNDWGTKTLAQPANYPLTQGGMSALDIINDLLKSSGCRPIYANAQGRWIIELIPAPASQTSQWMWYGSPGPGVSDAQLDQRMVLLKGNSYSGDVHNVTNQWVFIQDGLSFQPVEGSGQYTVNNTTRPPADQNTVGRVIREVQTLQASGQADLKTQGDAIVTTALSQAESLTIQTCAWPIGAHFDVFGFYHAALPFSPSRTVQAQGWVLPLWGDPMVWSTTVVDF